MHLAEFMAFSVFPVLKISSEQWQHGTIVTVCIAITLVIIIDVSQFILLPNTYNPRPEKSIWIKTIWVLIFAILVAIATWAITRIDLIIFSSFAVGLMIGTIFMRRSCTLSLQKDIYRVEIAKWSGSGAFKWGSVAFIIMSLFIAAMTIFIAYRIAPPSLISSPEFWFNVLGGMAKQPTLGAVALLVIEIGMLLGGLRIEHIINPAVPNQGIISSIENSARATVIPLTIAAVYTFIAFLYVPSWVQLIPAFWLLTILIAVWYGAQDALYHTVLRTLLSWSREMPRKLVQYLDYTTQVGFLKKVGGSYEFIHPTILKHFAEM